MGANHPSSADRVAYVNGALVPEREASISIRDRGFVYGDCVFDTARTFDGRLFELERHVDRLWESLAYVMIPPPMSKAEMAAAHERLVEANRPALRAGEDYWVMVRVSAGLQTLDGEPPWSDGPWRDGPTVVIDCAPLPLRARARFFVDGVEMAVAARRRIAPEALSPNAKTNNYLNMMLAQREVAANNPNAWALMLDHEGNLAEGAGCNLFVVKNGVAHTPRRDFVLNGISRQIAIEICRDIGVPIVEDTVSTHLGAVAEEAFITSTSLCACPVKSIDGRVYSAGAPGPVTARIMAAFAERVGLDYVAQYKRFLGNAPGGAGL